MFPEFGQAPLRLELDLDTYEESWTHVAAYRAQSGWMLLARATIQSEHDWLRATLIAACDEYDHPIPAWRAEHLTQCRWDKLEHCYEQPPEILDELLCEEEGAFYARWQREMNTGLAALYDQAQRNIEALEAKSSARAYNLELQIADLRRRRRMAEATDAVRATLTEIITDMEAEHDETIARLADQRSALRRQADAAEEALWQHTDVLIEVEPMCLIRWRARITSNSAHILSPEYGRSGGTSLRGVHGKDLQGLERRRADEALEQARHDEEARAEALAKQAENVKGKQPIAQIAPDANPQRPEKHELPKRSPFLRKLATASAALPSKPAISEPSPNAPIEPVRPAYGKLDIERDKFVAMLDGLVEEVKKHPVGSRKYREIWGQRADLSRRIAELDAAIAQNGAPPVFAEMPPKPGAVDRKIEEIATARIAAVGQQVKAGK